MSQTATDDVFIITIDEVRILSQSIAEELSRLNLSPLPPTLTLMSFSPLSPLSQDDEEFFCESVEEFKQGKETIICGKLKETQQSVMLLRLRDGGYGLLSSSRSPQAPTDEIGRLLKESFLSMRSTPAVKFDIDITNLLREEVAQAHDLPLDADRCRVCKQKRCRVHGRQYGSHQKKVKR